MSKKGFMANYIKNLQEENEQLKLEVEKLRSEPIIEKPYTNLSSQEDGRDRDVEIFYGINKQNMRLEVMPLNKAFERLISFYSAFSKPTDRNVIREYMNEFGIPTLCNNALCYVKKTFKDMRSGQTIENLRKEVPLWLAVDDVVQKDQQVELISKKEYDDFYREHVKSEIRRDRAYLDKKRQQLVDEVMMEDDNG